MRKYSAWLKDNYKAAESATAGSGILPEILLSQAIIESSKNGIMPGTTLAKQYNNYFGIKAGSSWKGATVNLKTKEFSPAGEIENTADNFRVYDTAADSFNDYVKLLNSKRYAAVKKYKTATAQAAALQAAGYSTNPNYSKIISSMAEAIKSAAAELKLTVKESAPAILFAAVATALILSGNGRN